MKLAVLTPVFSPYRGGIGVSAHANAKMARERGYEVTVYTPWYPSLQKKGVPQRETVDGFRVQRLTPLFSYGNAALLPQLFFLLKRFDAIHLHYPFLEVASCVLFARLIFRKKYIVTYHMDLIGKRRFDRFLFNLYTAAVLSWVIHFADKIIVSSLDYARASRLAVFLKTSTREKIVSIPHSVDTNVYAREIDTAVLRAKYGIAEKQQVILFVGGLDSAHYFKGVEYLLEAFELLVRMMEQNQQRPLPVLVLVGYGNLISSYQNLAGQLEISDKVIFAGALESQRLLVQHYSLAAVTVLPSIDQSESFGIVLIESLACSTPVIASDLPGIRSVVKDGINGYLVAPRDVNGLAKKMYALVCDPEQARSMGNTGRTLVEKEYSYQHIKEMFLSII